MLRIKLCRRNVKSLIMGMSLRNKLLWKVKKTSVEYKKILGATFYHAWFSASSGTSYSGGETPIWGSVYAVYDGADHAAVSTSWIFHLFEDSFELPDSKLPNTMTSFGLNIFFIPCYFRS